MYRGVNGTIDSVTVDGINIAGGIAIYLSSMGNDVNVEVKGCTISNFYKNGITANYEGLTANIHDNNIIGSGPRDDVAQNGIQIGYGATGSVVENTVSDIAYTGTNTEACGILFVDSSGTARDNIVTNCQVGIVAQARWYPPVTCDVTIKNNTINATDLTGLPYIAGTGAVTWDENATIDVTIKNNNLTGAGYGEGVSIGSESEYAAGTVNATIEGNDISNWGHGIWIGPTSNQIVIKGNNIINNVEVDSGIHVTGVDVSGIKINFNNIEGNTAYGVYNDGTDTLNATLNWWGDVSGPSGVGNGTGDAVSANVIYDPWLDSPYPEGEPINFTGVKSETVSGTTEIDAKTEADTSVLINATAQVNVTIAEYSRNPGSGFIGDIGKYIDVHIDDPDNVTSITIKLYYTDEDIAGLDENSLRMLWWNGTTWVPCSNSGVNTIDRNGYSGYVWAVINAETTPRLWDLQGTPFGARGSPPKVPVFNIFGLIALVGILNAVAIATLRERNKKK